MSRRKGDTKRRGKDSQSIKQDAQAQSEYDYHLPVMLSRACEHLIQLSHQDTTKHAGLYIDGTLGGGGHTAEILRRTDPWGRVMAFDQDPDAIAYSTTRFAEILIPETATDAQPWTVSRGPRIEILQANFSQAGEILVARNLEDTKERAVSGSGCVTGVLLDLGVSSHQLNERSRGFTFSEDAPLDMRLGQRGQTAEEFLNEEKEETLERVFRLYGEERLSRVVARRIVQYRRAVPLVSSVQLREIIEECIPFKERMRSLSRVFQAIRIYLNQELDRLEQCLTELIPLVEVGGRIVVLSYHSLEDRIVKNIFREFATPTKRDEITGQPLDKPLLEVVTKRVEEADQEEISRNSRARSAKLRCAEKIAMTR